MALFSTKEMLLDAQKRKYAVPAFNIHNLETIRVVLDAAEEEKSPVILAATPGTLSFSGAEYILAIVKAGAAAHSIPVALHLDHFENIELIKKYIDLGFTSAMIDASFEAFEENVIRTREIVEYARKKRVTVEAELGRLVGQEDNIIVDEDNSDYTNPKLAVEFVNMTEIDSLAVAIGTVHGVYKSEPRLDFARLERIRERVGVPLVLHGASGVPKDSVRRTIELGICKVNIATELKMPFAGAVKEYFNNNPNAIDPRKFLAPGCDAMKSVVIDKIKMCKSNGMAI